MKRMYIDQPSKNQLLHKLHGVNVLAVKETDLCMRVYFLSGEIISQQVPNICLSEGWTTND